MPMKPTPEVGELISLNENERNNYDTREVHPYHDKVVVAHLMVRGRLWVVSVTNQWNPRPPSQTTGEGRYQILPLRIEAGEAKAGRHVFRLQCIIVNGVCVRVDGIHTGYKYEGEEGDPYTSSSLGKEKMAKIRALRRPEAWAEITECAMAHPVVSHLLEYKKPDGLSDDLYHNKMER